jgi:transcriptional regulator with XRE-family HTH domain
MNDRKEVAERLKVARSLAGYGNRKNFCAQFDISYDTLDAWERGKNPLTSKGAKRIVEILKSAEIYCSEDWLMTGEGLSPRPLKEIIPEGLKGSSASLTLFEKNLTLVMEISTFTTLNKDSIITLIKDDTMLPFYEKGDHVGGTRIRGDDFKKAILRRCIVEFVGGEIAVGQLKKTSSSYEVYPVNKEASATPLVESSIKISSVAPIVWHRTFLPE